MVLLCYIGGKMLYDTIKNKDESENEVKNIGLTALLVQGVATSIDALSVGFTIADYSFSLALLAVLIIAIITFFICFAGILIGKGKTADEAIAQVNMVVEGIVNCNAAYELSKKYNADMPIITEAYNVLNNGAA